MLRGMVAIPPACTVVNATVVAVPSRHSANYFACGSRPTAIAPRIVEIGFFPKHARS
jgi:hypothetical protein